MKFARGLENDVVEVFLEEAEMKIVIAQIILLSTSLLTFNDNANANAAEPQKTSEQAAALTAYTNSENETRPSPGYSKQNLDVVRIIRSKTGDVSKVMDVDDRFLVVQRKPRSWI